MAVHARNKGKRGEREALELIQSWVTPVYESAGIPAPTIERNLMQSRDGGFDLVGVDWLALEVKRQEQVLIGAWWKQALRQAKNGQVPVLMWRGNRQPWRFRIRVATAHGHGTLWSVGYVDADTDKENAKRWLQSELWWRLQGRTKKL